MALKRSLTVNVGSSSIFDAAACQAAISASRSGPGFGVNKSIVSVL